MRSSVVLFVLCGLASSAHAFDEATQFYAPSGVAHAATLGASGEGIYFTGAPRYSGLDCSSCHTDGPRKLGLTLGADDPTLFTTGYDPGRTYELAVTITHETEGLAYATPTCTEVPTDPTDFTYVQCNHNNFALEVDDASLLPLPDSDHFCAAPPGSGGCPKADADADEIVVAPGGDAVLANHAHSMSMPYELLHNDVTEWHLWWTAPTAGSGPLTFYAAAVDGNGGGGTIDDDQDPFGDDTVKAAITVAEVGGASRAPATSGCSMATRGGAPSVLALLVVLAFCASRRRHMLALVVLASCGGNGPEMQPGGDCLACHKPGGGAHPYSVAGTVYGNGAAPSFDGLIGATVHVVDSSGATADLVTNSVGNFYTDQDFAFPITVSVGRGDAQRTMEPTVTDGSCNHCHALPPKESAQGRVSIPSAPP